MFFLFSRLFLLEAYWALLKVYIFNKEAILKVFEDFIEADGVELDEDGLVQ